MLQKQPLYAHSVVVPVHPTPPYLAQDQKDDNSQQCSGMYSKASWGGPVDPFILITFMKQEQDHVVSLVIYEYRDKAYIGRQIGDDPYQVGKAP